MIKIWEVMIGEPTALDRTVYIPIRKSTDYVTPQPSFGTVKAKISTKGATAVSSSASIAVVDASGAPGFASLVLALTEIAELQDLLVTVNGSGYFGQCIVRVVNYSPKAEGAASDASLRQRMGVTH